MNWERFETYLNDKMKIENIPGVAVGVSINGKTVYKTGFGYKNVEANEPMTPDTICGIASITKSFTALAILMLEEEGLLFVKDPVINYLPEFEIKGIDNMSEIKVHHLLTHTTGLSPLERNEDLNKFSEHLDYIKSQSNDIIGKPGEKFNYCNDTFLLLGAIIEKLTGKLYRRHITDVLLNKLKMYRSTMSLEEIDKLDNVSTLYNLSPEQKELVQTSWLKLGNYEVGGGIRSTVTDLLKYGNLFVNKGYLNGERLISYENLKKMWDKHIKIADNSYYGNAFVITPDYNGLTLVDHGGGQPGVSSIFGFIPEKGIVITVLCNVKGIRVDHIWIKAINTVLDLPFESSRD
ncbi:serine hydrolase domain-containing protein [Haloplasma contractile]|uniref:Beta-lactamase protein n=1 Tax=Haloplasma contractile SSD-17B TaxID=1033810 RepID=F7Q1V5_9MOLU|nr:serine hydrolase domain-containing protein [Haloplasma contractile]ERJ12234.1 beta-lactamase protein [Haloplasma contractile SSD-17B]